MCVEREVAQGKDTDRLMGNGHWLHRLVTGLEGTQLEDGGQGGLGKEDLWE